ncbi:2-keto-4-pentenoate hydratase/2-oxohepta-3-ene-1,7-dioic acid hydratase in catechol pathway [Amycolatopsis bartoniae]|uniref:Hydroxylase n=1 Tax=Amycolatopsis bartoniae TaxID=941986 RepID=A0A8H9M9J4_9PSEU|nr:fumarylacetoacetate hydrolase family protein [Amycolatopsis bartoniae]MBB2937909.1 2-keto-4-pentenoate hydratase/2-oxohepta-3-ene-1,7-dioic acid hydratase in catechol pathway [Amycolatopsis bartoniae]TVT08594.1 fumarylacetoacetate hydrolase family protein [Amycolatopsis bartoniae]GHF41623.1 hydroxylase [Amycolatopsis bartoniae]
MKFATVEEPDGTVRCGLVEGDNLLRLPAGTTVLELIRAGQLHDAGAAARAAGDAVPLSGLRLLPPLEPPTVRDFVAFEQHVAGMVAGDGGSVPPEWYEAPTFYFTNPYALLGAHDDVPVPPGSQLFDFELEVAAVVGRDAASPSPEEVDIAGYTVFNDWSARDLQRREMKVGLGPAKGKDSATTLGPWLVTADELESYRDSAGFLGLDLRVSVNGTQIGQDLLSHMGWPFEELAAYAGRGTRVRAGDVLGSGTCGNGGCLAELWGRGREIPPLKPGDVVEMTVEGIGTIRNTVVEGIELPPVRPARKRS